MWSRLRESWRRPADGQLGGEPTEDEVSNEASAASCPTDEELPSGDTAPSVQAATATAPSAPRTLSKVSSASRSGWQEAGGEDPAPALELEVALFQARQLAGQKDEELRATGQLVARLQQALELQQREQGRLASLEEAVSRRSDGEDDKVEKLLLAVAGGKQLAEEQADELKRTTVQLEEEQGLFADEQARRRGLEGQLAEKERRLKEIKAKLDDDAGARALLEQQLLEMQNEARDAQRHLSEEIQKRDAALLAAHENRCADGDGGAAKERYDELQQQLAHEISRRRVTQYQHLNIIRQMSDVRQQLYDVRHGEERGSRTPMAPPMVHPPPSWHYGAPVLGLPEEHEEVYQPNKLMLVGRDSSGAALRRPAAGTAETRTGSPVRLGISAAAEPAGSLRVPAGQAVYRRGPAVYYAPPSSGGALAPSVQARLRNQSSTFA